MPTATVTTSIPSKRNGQNRVERFEIDLDTINKDSIELYGWHACGLLAAELHVITGLPYVIIEKRDETSSGWRFSHVGVQPKTGKMLDVEGVRSIDKLPKHQRAVTLPTTAQMRRRVGFAAPRSGQFEEDAVAASLGLPVDEARYLTRRQAQALLGDRDVRTALKR